eukprot:342303-Pelagomonas_calceolata.AAC.3
MKVQKTPLCVTWETAVEERTNATLLGGRASNNVSPCCFNWRRECNVMPLGYHAHVTCGM